MFKLHVFSARSLDSIPSFVGPARRAERPEAAPEANRQASTGTASGRSAEGHRTRPAQIDVIVTCGALSSMHARL